MVLGRLRGTRAWLAGAALLALAGAPLALAGGETPKPPAATGHKSATKPASTTSKSAATTKPSAKTASARRAPAPPAAVLAPPIDTVLRHGCLQAEGSILRTRLDGVEPAFEDFVQTVSQSDQREAASCLQFAAALGAEGHGSSVALWRGDASAERPTVAVLFRAAASDSVVAKHLEFAFPNDRRREIIVPALEASGTGHEEIAALPDHLRWQLEVIVRKMQLQFDVGPAHRLRLVIETQADGGSPRFAAVELSDSEAGRLVESILWLDRPAGPGALFATSGTDYERALWTSPVREARASRGVGQGSVTVRRVVAAKPGGGSGGTRTVRTVSRGHHIGIDFPAPKGTPVHAVADAEVSYAGRKSGYGNLLILDHGDGHQTYYAHLSAFSDGMKPGTRVLRGDVVGRVGSTGFSTGPHLHFEVRKDGLYIDPVLAQNRLAFWSLQPDDHAHLLAHLLVLDLTRQPAASRFALSSPAPRMGGAGATASEEP